MNPTFAETVEKMKVFHKDYNLNKKDNLDEIPKEPAVFGIFAIIHDTPIHSRYIGSTDNLRKAVRDVFENSEREGLKKFMQGPWIQMLCYELLTDFPEDDRKRKEEEWIKEYEPQVTEEGEYPEYRYEWPGDK